MSYRYKLFHLKDPYKLEGTDDLFVKAMKENCLYQYQHCSDYKRILDSFHFDINSLKTIDDLASLPFIPTLYFKHHELYSMSKKRMIVKATSSGTSSGIKSKIGFNAGSLLLAFAMVRKIFAYHHIWSLKPTHFIIFGYEPKRTNQTAISKTGYGFTFTAPPLSKDYAIRYIDGKYQVDLENIKNKLIKYSKGKAPVRTLGFPAYTYFLLRDMKEQGIFLKMPKGSMITIGGGWKQFYAEQIDKRAFYALVKEVLDIDEDHIIEFFGAVEHPILYTDCKAHHFHIPVYGRVIIRDVNTLKPVPNGQMGIINLLTPLVKSVPLLSICTDDIGILHDEKCACGLNTPYLEIVGRVGLSDIKTCTAGAEDLLKEMKI